ncbi:zinc finger and SCAN domain-containing protein 5A [Ictidomys tridecemlineatus]|nr:zinc finger and SCAN domain-containing protein 5A [Ictidomys tridecemlineatus]
MVSRTSVASRDADPIQDLKRISELCHLWLRPDLHTKEEIMDQLILEQFMISMPEDLQVLARESGVTRCRDLEDLLRSHRKPQKWGEEVLPEPVPAQIDLQNQGEDVKEGGDLPVQGSPEPQLPQGPADSVKKPQEVCSKNARACTPGPLAGQGEDAPMERHSKRQRRSHEASPDPGRFLGPAGVNSVVPSSTAPPAGPVGAEAAGAARHRCGVCQKGLAYGSQLVVHQWSHTGERPFKCSECRKGFMQASDLRVHKRIHTGERPYECSDCKKRFSHLGNLYVHRRLHTQAKPYTCDVCGSAFRHLWSFKRHGKTHQEMPPDKVL